MEQASSLRLHAYLQLVRLPNMVTSCADVLAGYIIVQWENLEMGVLALLMVASAFLYGAGCAMNDVSDRAIDLVERPIRPIPSGAVTVAEAILLQWLLSFVAISAAFAIGFRPGIIALVLLGLITLYNRLVKYHQLYGPLTMGFCRGANVLLGMSVAFPFADFRIAFPVVMVIYVVAITIVSRGENGAPGEGNSGFAAAAWIVAVAGAAALAIVHDYQAIGYLIFFIPMSGAGFILATKTGHAGKIQRGVVMMILAIPLLDSVCAAGVQGWKAGAPSAACGVTAFFLSRIFKVT